MSKFHRQEAAEAIVHVPPPRRVDKEHVGVDDHKAIANERAILRLQYK